MLIVIVTTNAPPVQPIRGATRYDTLTTIASAIFNSDANPDLFEAWEIPSLSFDRLLKALTDKFEPDTKGTRHGQAVLLSGDVHHSFATRLSYKANNRYGDKKDQAQKASAVVAQLVASSFKKQDNDTVGFQREGYFYVPSRLAKGLIAREMTEGYVGWNVPQGSSYEVGSSKKTVYSTDMVGHFNSVDPIRKITNDDPTIQIFPLVMVGIISRIEVTEIDLKIAPDYRYRLNYLLPSSRSFDKPTTTKPIPPMPPSGATADQRKAALDAFNAATDHYREHNGHPGWEKLIGRNNISEVTFDWGPRTNTGDPKKVNHTVRWRTSILDKQGDAPDPDLPKTYVVFTGYTVSLDPDDPDPDFADIKAKVEGQQP